MGKYYHPFLDVLCPLSPSSSDTKKPLPMDLLLYSLISLLYVCVSIYGNIALVSLKKDDKQVRLIFLWNKTQ